MRHIERGITVIAIAALLAGCAIATETNRKRGSSDPIIASEIQAATHRQALDTYSVIRQLRPGWMLPGRRPAVVFVNGVAWGPPPSLRQVPPEAVREIRYVPVWQSAPYHSGQHDVILVVTH